MKILVFDTSSIITITTNSLLPTIKPLKESFNGKFIIPPEVKRELVDNPLNNRRYSLEAMIVLKSIELEFLEIDNTKTDNKLQTLANSIFSDKKKNITILQKAECDALSLALKIGADAYSVDERTTRLLIEDPKQLRTLLQEKLHTTITVNNEALKEFQRLTKGIKIIRSAELMTVAYEKGLLNKYLPIQIKKEEKVKALLWALRLNGCALSTEEIEKITKISKQPQPLK